MKKLQLKSRHGWWMMICCGAMLLGFLLLSSNMGGSWGGYLLILLCPAMHLIMHSRHSGKDSAPCHKGTEPVQSASTHDLRSGN